MESDEAVQVRCCILRLVELMEKTSTLMKGLKNDLKELKRTQD